MRMMAMGALVAALAWGAPAALAQEAPAHSEPMAQTEAEDEARAALEPGAGDSEEVSEEVNEEASEAEKKALSDTLLRMLSGRSAVDGQALDTAIEQADAYPLGSRENPVRVEMPQGQRAYLARLRCSDVRAPDFVREGSVGVGPFGNIIDVYLVTCDGSDPAQTRIFMDMYHKNYAEQQPVAGFGMAGG